MTWDEVKDTDLGRFSMAAHPPKTAPNPMLYVGFVLPAVGAGLVLYYKPQS
jgi:hypothetical protein